MGAIRASALKHPMCRLHFYLAALTTMLLGACGAGGALWQAEQSCIKFPTPDARAACEQKAKADNADYVRETQMRKDQARALDEAQRKTGQTQPDGTPSPARPQNDLCFKRAGTGEWVCPN